MRVPKHVQLGIRVKRKCGSVDLYAGWIALGTPFHTTKLIKLAEDQASRREPRKFSPNNIQPSVFVAFIYDNCDHNIESMYNVTELLFKIAYEPPTPKKLIHQ